MLPTAFNSVSIVIPMIRSLTPHPAFISTSLLIGTHNVYSVLRDKIKQTHDMTSTVHRKPINQFIAHLSLLTHISAEASYPFSAISSGILKRLTKISSGPTCNVAVNTKKIAQEHTKVISIGAKRNKLLLGINNKMIIALSILSLHLSKKSQFCHISNRCI